MSPGSVRIPQSTLGFRESCAAFLPVEPESILRRPFHEGFQGCAVHHLIGTYRRVAGVDDLIRRVRFIDVQTGNEDERIAPGSSLESDGIATDSG